MVGIPEIFKRRIAGAPDFNYMVVRKIKMI
jgi:hypothetical protein